jgi:hypothetical protein
MTAPRKAKKTAAKRADVAAGNLARTAGEIAQAAGLKSKYLPGDAREFLDLCRVERDGQHVVLSLAKPAEGQDPVRAKLTDLKKYAAKGEGDISKELRVLTSGAKRLYGRKAAILALASLDQEEARDA